MKIIIMRSGPLLTIQDRGRFGYSKFGIGNAGAMDQDAYELANALVGNTKGEAVLEATLMGPEIYFSEDCVCAITGADMKPMLDDMPVENNKAIMVPGGATLKLGFTTNGCRSYIAFAGGIDVPEVMQSRSTDIKCGIGGLKGRKLEDEDQLDIAESLKSFDDILKKSQKGTYPQKTYDRDITVRVVMGPQEYAFSEKGIETFLSQTYEVKSESDRMGIRLQGEAIESKAGVDIVSDGIAFGSIQIPNNGQPIVLMADHQTTGGYAKIATVIRVDLPRLAQALPGNKVHFQKITVKEAEKLCEKHMKRYRK